MDQKQRLKELKTFRDKVTKKYGEGHIIRADEIAKPTRIPTGSLMLDRITGGGWQVGKTHQIYGWEHTGKSTVLLKTAAMAQRMCNKCHTFMIPEFLEPPETDDAEDLKEWRRGRHTCLRCGAPYHDKDRKVPRGGACKECGEKDMIVEMDLDDEWVRNDGDVSCECGKNSPYMVFMVETEDKLDMQWAQKLGVDTSRLHVEYPEYGEQGIDIALEAVGSGITDLLLYDSIAGISSATEQQKSSVEDDVPAVVARLMNKFFRQLPKKRRQALNKHGILSTVLMTNQIRHKIGVQFGNPETRPGGHGQKFAFTTTIYALPASHDVQEFDDGPGRAGKSGYSEKMSATEMVTMRFRCEKNGSANTTGMKGMVEMVVTDQDEEDAVYSTGDFKDHSLVFRYGRSTNVITRSEGSKRGWSVEGWPLVYHNQGDLILDLHRRWYFKMHLQSKVVEKMLEDWKNVSKG